MNQAPTCLSACRRCYLHLSRYVFAYFRFVGAVLIGGVPYASTVASCVTPSPVSGSSNTSLYLSAGGGSVSVRVNAVSVSRLWVRAVTSVCAADFFEVFSCPARCLLFEFLVGVTTCVRFPREGT